MTTDIIILTSIALISKEEGAYGAVAQLFLVARAGENGVRSHTLCKDETTELLPYKRQE